jgi:hypothetical protein
MVEQKLLTHEYETTEVKLVAQWDQDNQAFSIMKYFLSTNPKNSYCAAMTLTVDQARAVAISIQQALLKVEDIS